MINVLLAFLKKDFENATSYKLSFILDITNVFLSIVSFYFLSKLIGSNASEILSKYNVDYFSFYIVGAAFSVYFWNSFSNVTGTIQTGQANGILEIMLATPTRLPVILFGSSLYGLVYSSIVAIYYLIAGYFLGVHYYFANFLTIIVVFFLTIATFTSMGLISAASILVFKRADPIAWFLGSVGALLGGSLFPISILPTWLQAISHILPITYALDAMRLVLLKGYTLNMIYDDVSALIIFTIILVPLSVFLFNKAIHWSKRTGGLLRY